MSKSRMCVVQLLYVSNKRVSNLQKNEKKRRVMYREKAERDENMVGHLSPSKRRSAASRRRVSLRQKQDDDDDMALGGKLLLVIFRLLE